MTGPPRMGIVGVGMVGVLLIGQPASSEELDEAARLSASFRRASQRVLPAVVTVRSERAPGLRGGPGRPLLRNPLDTEGEPGSSRPSNGSGVVIDAERGLVVTNDHVVADASRVLVTLANGREREAQAVHLDPRSDLAILIIATEALQLQQVAWGDSDALEIGDWVLAIGQPFGLSGTVTAGIVSGTGRGVGSEMYYEDLIQTDAAINPGNSGGPLVNLAGEVVGINTAIQTRDGFFQGVGFAVPSNRARRVVSDLMEFGHVRRARIGVTIRRIDPETAERIGEPGAVPITGVAIGSPADVAGLRPGDVIVALDGQPIAGPGTLQAAIEVAPVGEPLRITVVRDESRRDVEVRPEPLAEPDPARPSPLLPTPPLPTVPNLSPFESASDDPFAAPVLPVPRPDDPPIAPLDARLPTPPP